MAKWPLKASERNVDTFRAPTPPKRQESHSYTGRNRKTPVHFKEKNYLVLKQSLISHLLCLLTTIWNQPFLQLQQQTCSRDAEQTCRTTLQKITAVTGAEIKLPILHQKCEGGAPCGSPLNLPIHLWAQTGTF